MAQPVKPWQPDPMEQQRQKEEARQLELGKAWHEGDMKRVGEMTQQMQADGVRGIGNEHYRAQEAYGAYLENEERRNAEASALAPVPPDREAEQDPIPQPEQDPRVQQAEDPAHQPETTPDRSQEADPALKPSVTYADLKREHAEAIAKSPEQGEKKLTFYEDRQREAAQDLEPGQERTDAKQNERDEKGEKQLAFAEDLSPDRNDDIER